MTILAGKDNYSNCCALGAQLIWIYPSILALNGYYIGTMTCAGHRDICGQN